MDTSWTSHLPQWTQQGAVYGAGESITLFWGNAAESKTPSSFPAIYSNDFFLTNDRPWSSYEHSATVSPKLLEREVPKSLLWESPSFETFSQHFSEAQSCFEKGPLKKIVLATETRARKTNSPQVFLKNSLGAVPPNTYLYGQWNQDRGFIGYTPEILFQIQGKIVDTMALAGTSATSSQDVLNSPKNREEHQWVIDDIQKTLQPFGSVDIGKTEVLPLTTLSHLHTPLSLEMKNTPVITELITALHPTPALGASPRSELHVLQPWRHGYGSFGAPFAIATSAATATALVGIRQLAWDEEYYYIRCGCGVVKDSQLEEEWQELLLKIQSVKKRFGWNEQ